MLPHNASSSLFPKNQLYLFKDLILFLYKKKHTSKMLNKRKVDFNVGEVTQGDSQSTVSDGVSGTKLKNWILSAYY